MKGGHGTGSPIAIGPRACVGGAAKPNQRTLATCLAALGVVFGDIGTSPLYTLQVAAESNGRAALARADVFGVVSLVLWALLIAVSLKYVTFVLRADNRGEGGILALLALLPDSEKDGRIRLVPLLVIAGAALLFGDGIITPAISVLSAFEGLERATPGLGPFVVPLTCVVLVGLFVLQRRGTNAVGKLFGPIMALWFIAIGVLGLKEIVRYPEMLAALSPTYGASYFIRHGFGGLRILGTIVLAITGAEALYADMGYFGAGPIRITWFGLVLPALALSYAGQGALVLRDSSAASHPFFSMVPSGPAAYALVVLAAVATIIASQALISGVFSLTHQAVQLGYFPRVTVIHTSRETEGHIYVPVMNWSLMIACIFLVVGFRHSGRLASAYGIAVSGTMAITSVAFFEVARKTWKWSAPRALLLLIAFLSFDLPFFGANALKFSDGGYIPLLVGTSFFIVMVDWHAGRQSLRRLLARDACTLPDFFELLSSRDVRRVSGTAVYFTATPGVPRPLSLHAKTARSIAECVVLLTIVIAHTPRVEHAHRFEVEPLSHGLYRVRLYFGYMEVIRVPRALAKALESVKPKLSLEDAIYYAGRESIVARTHKRMYYLPAKLFSFLERNTKSAIDDFALPPDRVVEIGTRLSPDRLA